MLGAKKKFPLLHPTMVLGGLGYQQMEMRTLLVLGKRVWVWVGGCDGRFTSHERSCDALIRGSHEASSPRWELQDQMGQREQVL